MKRFPEWTHAVLSAGYVLLAEVGHPVASLISNKVHFLQIIRPWSLATSSTRGW